MKNILLLAPMLGNGGIASWTTKFIKTFPNNEYNVIPVSSVIKAKDANASLITRIIVGIKELFVVRNRVKEVIANNKIDIFHTTTSGSLGSVRDYCIGKLCKKHKIKTIMHCRYGCMPDVLKTSGIMRRLLLLSLKQYDQIWVLDKYTYNALDNLPHTHGKVFLTPNSIEVNEIAPIRTKQCKKFAFIANIVPTKGIFELIEAFKSVNAKDICLDIIGPIDEKTNNKLMNAISTDARIQYHGKMHNKKAVEFIKNIDALVLPTYYSGEAFPISILEAMSYGKLVISTPRAAIPDMLTAVDGTQCGIIVPEQDIEELHNAIEFAYNNPVEVNQKCIKAYQKVWTSYRTTVVYEIYRTNYAKLVM